MVFCLCCQQWLNGNNVLRKIHFPNGICLLLVCCNLATYNIGLTFEILIIFFKISLTFQNSFFFFVFFSKLNLIFKINLAYQKSFFFSKLIWLFDNFPKFNFESFFFFR